MLQTLQISQLGKFSSTFLAKPLILSVLNIIRMTSNVQAYKTQESGSLYTTDYKLYLTDDKGPISPMHDVPLFADKSKNIYNMIVEVPRWTNAKMEISLKDKLNPIKQDVKKGKVRFVANCFPHHGYIWNYGALPQTWENPGHVDSATQCKGDNDPIDVIEIGYKVAKRGAVSQVKLLGTFALIDEGETDWKLIAIDVTDPLADQLNDVDDVEKHLPGLLNATVEWFRGYKIPDGKPENKFAFGNKAKGAKFAREVVEQTHGFWKELISKTTDGNGISVANVLVDKSPEQLTREQAFETLASAPEPTPAAPLDPIVDKWHYVQLA